MIVSFGVAGLDGLLWVVFKWWLVGFGVGYVGACVYVVSGWFGCGWFVSCAAVLTLLIVG